MNNIKKHRIAILKNEDPFDHLPWVKACEAYKNMVNYEVIDITLNDWQSKIGIYCPDICVLKPSGKTSLFRTLYQERIDILVHDLNIRVFPSYDELRIYENKRFLASWLQINNIPHPDTWVFFHKKEAIDAVKKMVLPLVGKINIGASGNGVSIIHSEHELKKYIEKAFSRGLMARTGPKFTKGRLIKRIWEKFKKPEIMINRLKTYQAVFSDKQQGFVILQKFVSHEYEWRVVRIGESFFAHKKLKRGNKASGSLLKNYDNPPFAILNFVKEITDRFGFFSQAVDIFETENGYLVNEMQCIFGQSDSFQMLVNNIPGRYMKINQSWVFEEGNFNENESYNLRLNYILKILEAKA